ncbi:hypothetical protein DFH09DRAFT_1354501 [Mycena vulgaris]|nr:hypothetical protein DFH09DRAFT_1354501 [Mycena vulgaris]
MLNVTPADALASHYRQIISIGNAIADRCRPAQTPSTAEPISLPTIDIPLPTPIYSKLLSLGIAKNISDALSRRYHARSMDLYNEAKVALPRACRDLANVPEHSALIPVSQLQASVIKAYIGAYMRSLNKLEAAAIAFAVSRVQQHAALNRTSLSDVSPPFSHDTASNNNHRPPRRPFNKEFDPFLQNTSSITHSHLRQTAWKWRKVDDGAAADRSLVSKPSPPRQAGRHTHSKARPHRPSPISASIDDEEVSEADSDYEEEDDEDEDLSDVLNPPAPRHAFPKLFDGYHKAAATAAKRPTVTIDECIAEFAKLHVYDPTTVFSLPFRIATTVIPSPAPLPALVRGKFTPSPVSPTTALNIVPAPRSRQRPFRSPSPYAQPATLASVSPRRKKVAGPPRRTPKRMPGSHRGVSPASSDTSTLRSSSEASTMRSSSEARTMRSLSPPSRTPSFESPSRTPSFGSSGFSSSRSSSGSSGPTTPTGSPSALPLEIVDSYLDIFGHGPQHSPVEASQHPRGKQQPYQFAFAGYARR